MLPHDGHNYSKDRADKKSLFIDSFSLFEQTFKLLFEKLTTLLLSSRYLLVSIDRIGRLILHSCYLG